ncbi:MAG: hypothetical protein GBAus27B_000160 [Mycoplasmataceae bacterium]|nr:MAG: hypothetical protein GBAus27B_000160 [Mycoplasmataceae bacterium]
MIGKFEKNEDLGKVVCKSKYSKHSDIYSLGMVFWEICAKNTAPSNEIKNNFTVMYNVGTNGLRETIPLDTPSKLKEIIADCWKAEPSERISLAEIETKLNNSEKIVEVLEIKTFIQFYSICF